MALVHEDAGGLISWPVLLRPLALTISWTMGFVPLSLKMIQMWLLLLTYPRV